MLHNVPDIYKSIALSYGFSSIKTVPKLQEFISLAREWEKVADDPVVKNAYRMLKSFEVQEPIASRLNEAFDHIRQYNTSGKLRCGSIAVVATAVTAGVATGFAGTNGICVAILYSGIAYKHLSNLFQQGQSLPLMKEAGLLYNLGYRPNDEDGCRNLFTRTI